MSQSQENETCHHFLVCVYNSLHHPECPVLPIIVSSAGYIAYRDLSDYYHVSKENDKLYIRIPLDTRLSSISPYDTKEIELFDGNWWQSYRSKITITVKKML